MEIIEFKNEDIQYKEYDLKEEFVDEKHKREKVTKRCAIFFQDVKANFKDSIGPVALQDIAEFGERRGHGYPAVVQWMRMLWKAGKVRRFYKGNWSNAERGNVTGLRWGVHYLWE